MLGRCTLGSALRVMSRFFRRPTLLTLTSGSAALLIIAVSCKGQDKDDYLLGPDQDDDGWPFELDCDDRDETVFPSADDLPGDGIDQDCSGSDANSGLGGQGGEDPVGPGDGDGDGDAPIGGDSGDGDGDQGTGGSGPERGIDADGDGFAASPEGEDCDDDRLTIYPGAYEIPLNGVDENCDGSDLTGVEQLVFPLSPEAVPHEAPDIAHGSIDGEDHFLLVWGDSRSAPGQEIYAQLTDAVGEPLGDEIEIEVDDLDAKTDVRVASKGDGFLVSWVTVNGLSVRQLNADGTPAGISLGYGPAGAVDPSIAYADGYWAVVWRDGATQEAWIRAMTVEEARGDVLELGGGGINTVSVTGRSDNFVVAWQGPVGTDSSGIWLQERSFTGYEATPAKIAIEGMYATPQIAWDGANSVLTFTVAGAFNYLAGLSFDEDLLVQQTDPFRLSSESLYLLETRTIASPLGIFSAWNDGRHQPHVPSAQAIYANGFTLQEGVPQLFWAGARAQVVDAMTTLGGLAASSDKVALSLLHNGAGAVLFVESP